MQIPVLVKRVKGNGYRARGAEPWPGIDTQPATDDRPFFFNIIRPSAQIGEMHPGLKPWTQKVFVRPDATVPYHPGAIAYYKSVGVWPVAIYSDALAEWVV